jgi:hypothetical protein
MSPRRVALCVRRLAADSCRTQPCRRWPAEAKSVFLLSHGTQDAFHVAAIPRHNVAACNAPGGEQSMRVRNITTCALGLAAALTLVASPLAAQQQDTSRLRTSSERRITTSKGEVVTPVTRVDTVYVTRYDTVRVDNTIVRVDTVTVTPPTPVVMPDVDGPMFWGLYGGSSWPWGNIDRVYTNGSLRPAPSGCVSMAR